MSILISGSTGTIGSQVIDHLRGKGVEVRALTRSPAEAKLPAGVTPVRGEIADVDSLRAALEGVSTFFLLVPNAADELTQALQALSIAREAGVKGIVYLSVFNGDSYHEVPHFAGKDTAERMIAALDMPVTILRPTYFMQNDLRQKEALLGGSVYASPIGGKGLSMVDIRDIGEAAALELLRREKADKPLARVTYDLVGPDAWTGEGLAKIWAEALGRPIRYAGNDLVAMEARLKTMMPAWYAYDLRLMFARYQSDGAAASPQQLARMSELLGRAPRSYRDFAKDTVAHWGSI